MVALRDAIGTVGAETTAFHGLIRAVMITTG